MDGEDIARFSTARTIDREDDLCCEEEVFKRLQDSANGAAICTWLRKSICDLKLLHMTMFAGPENHPGFDIQIVKEYDGTLVIIDCTNLILGTCKNFLREQLMDFEVIQAALEKLASHLNAQTAPTIALLEEEVEWLRDSGPLSVKVKKGPIKYYDSTRPGEHTDTPPKFNVWRPFTGKSEDPLVNFASHSNSLSTAQREDAANAINWHIDSYFDRLAEVTEECATTDSEAIHAAALMCGGHKVWKAAMKSPIKHLNVWPVSDDAEELLIFSDWG